MGDDMKPKKVVVVGGGTRQYLDGPHLYLGSKATGKTARKLAELCRSRHEMDVELVLTQMAAGASTLLPVPDTNEDLAGWADQLIADPRTKMVFWTPSVLDFQAVLPEATEGRWRTADGGRVLQLKPTEKILSKFRKARKDIFLVAAKQTAGATEAQLYEQALLMLKRSSANLVLANDAVSKVGMIVTPEEAVYGLGLPRDALLQELVSMAYLRSSLTFTQSTVVAGEPVPWASPDVPAVLREVVDHCIQRGAYRKVNGGTAGHFAVRLDDSTFLSSRRRTDFNRLAEIGLVRVETDGPDTVLAYGSKPSVGGQSQRIVFNDHPGMNSIVHFHCPIRPGSPIPVRSQREYECGSHQCGENTSNGLQVFPLPRGSLLAVYLDNHGPNIVFNSEEVGAKDVIDFIEAHFDLTQKSGGVPGAAAQLGEPADSCDVRVEQ